MSATTKTTYQGHTVNMKTKEILGVMNYLLRLDINGGETSDMTMTQGSYSTGVSASGGTHDGGGVFDLTATNIDNRVKVGRKIGAPGWERFASSRWPHHGHFFVDGDPTKSAAAEDQEDEYHHRGDGLLGGAPDYGYHMDVFPKFIYHTTRARWINVVPAFGYSQPTSSAERRIDGTWRAEGYVTDSNDLCRVRVGQVEWFVDKAGRFFKRSNWVRRPSGYTAKVEAWTVAADLAYGRNAPGPDAEKIGTPLARGTDFTSLGYVTRDNVTYVLNRGGRWFTATSLTVRAA